VTLAFGADELVLPVDDPTDVTALASAVGRPVVQR
jgi:hypothetical protein